MEKIRRHALVAMLCACVFNTQAQQAQLISALIDGCAVSNDGADEWVMVYSGGSDITASAIQVLYGTSSPANTDFTETYRAIDGTSNTFVSNLNTALGTCDFSFVNSQSDTNIPAGSHVLIFNDDLLTSGSSINYDAWCSAYQPGSSIYVLFSTDNSWPSSGLFANAPASNRFFRSTISGNTVDFNYSDNWVTTAGNYVTWNDGGGSAAIYSNYTGCQPTDLSALPITLLSFAAMSHKDHVAVSWVTAEEENNSHFTLERSKDAMHWESIGMIAGAGNPQEPNEYAFEDRAPYTGRNYYRLSQTDHNGTSETFEIILVMFDPRDIALNIFPNPSRDFIEIDCAEQVDCLTLIDTQGRQYRVDQADAGSMRSRFDIRNLPQGIYRVLIHGSETLFREKLMKQ